MVRGNTTEEYLFHRNSLFNTRFRNFALTISVGVALLIFSRNAGIGGPLRFALAGLATVFGVSSIIFASTLKWPEDGLTSSSKQQTLAWISLVVSSMFTVVALWIGGVNLKDLKDPIISASRKLRDSLTPQKPTVAVTPSKNVTVL
jgi:hypothetical protein